MDLFDIDFHIFTVIKFLFNLGVRFNYIYIFKLGVRIKYIKNNNNNYARIIILFTLMIIPTHFNIYILLLL